MQTDRRGRSQIWRARYVRVLSEVLIAMLAVLAFGGPVLGADDVDPPSSPTEPRWRDSTGLLVERTSAGDERLRAAWRRSSDPETGVVEYRVQLAESPDFAEVLAERYTGSTSPYEYFDSTDGVTSGSSYHFRVLAVDGAGNESAWSPPSNEVGVRANADGPAIAHAPVPTATYGRPIPISVVSTCGAESDCTATLGYRTTPVPSQLIDVDLMPGDFTRVPLERVGTTSLNSRDAVRWSGEIPGDVVTTTGVDYFIEMEDTFATSRFPGTPFLGTPYTPGIQGTGTYHHVHTVTPPLLSHTPPPFGRSDEPLPLELTAVCSTDCTATLYFRTTDGPVTSSEEGIVAENGELLATPDWPRVEMSETGTEASADGYGTATVFRAQVPGGYVDTRGVDYFFHVTDGHTQAWLPGSTYEGYYAPLDGMRTGYYHARVTETPHIVHAPPPASSYREPIEITGHANCPETRTCEATLFYRTTDRTVLSGDAGFTQTAMTVDRVESVDGNDVVRVAGEIPSEVADTRGVDYFFSVTDGSTTSWWPGAAPNDGYLVTDGVRVGYAHVRVLEPPHFVHAPVPVAEALEDLTITTDLLCATEGCDVELTYRSGDDTVTVPMERTEVRETTDAGRLEVWEATVPASDVTTRGLSYLMTATDGYTNTAAPGTFYSGAYVPMDGDSVSAAGTTAMFPVRVLEPPHPVHAPVLLGEAGEPIAVDALSNCTTGSCAGTLHWRPSGDVWREAPMTAVQDPLSDDLWSFSGTIPGDDVTPSGVEYRVEVDDGYVTGSTPTWTVVVPDPALEPPTVDPEPLEPLSGHVTVSAEGEPDVVIVELFVDDVLLVRASGSETSVRWDTTNVADGTYDVWYRVTTSSGQNSVSGATSVSVANLL